MLTSSFLISYCLKYYHIIKAAINTAVNCDDPPGQEYKVIRLVNEDFYDNLPLHFEGTNIISISNTNPHTHTLTYSALCVRALSLHSQNITYSVLSVPSLCLHTHYITVC